MKAKKTAAEAIDVRQTRCIAVAVFKAQPHAGDNSSPFALQILIESSSNYKRRDAHLRRDALPKRVEHLANAALVAVEKFLRLCRIHVPRALHVLFVAGARVARDILEQVYDRKGAAAAAAAASAAARCADDRDKKEDHHELEDVVLFADVKVDSRPAEVAGDEAGIELEDDGDQNEEDLEAEGG